MNSTFKFLANTPLETRDLGRRLAQISVPGDVFSLEGELGAGKTEFAKGFAEGLGITEHILSPTFIVENVYDIPETPPAGIHFGLATFHHLDLYRLFADRFDHSLFDFHSTKTVALVEWASRIPAVGDRVTGNVRITILEANRDNDSVRPEQDEISTEFASRQIEIDFHDVNRGKSF